MSPPRWVAPRAATARAGAVVAALALLLALAWPSLPARADDVPAMSVAVDVTGLVPQVLRPGGDVVVTATLRNTGPRAVAEPRMTVSLRPSGFISRSSLDLWRGAEPLGEIGVPVLDRDLGAPLEPGETREVRVRVPAERLGLVDDPERWGPRGLAVSVVDRADPARARLGVERTFLLWYPADEVTATRVTALVPLVGPAVDPYDDAWVGDLETLASGRLADVLDATDDATWVSWALDPWLVDVGTAEPERDGPELPGDGPTAGPEGDEGDAAADDAADEGADDAPADGDTPATEASDDDVPRTASAGPVTRAWAEELLAATVDRDVHVLPYGDADVPALAHTGSTDVLATARDRSARTVRSTDLPDGAQHALVLPVDPLPDLATAALVADGDGGALVVGPGTMPAPEVLTFTPSNKTTVSTAAGPATVLIPDERLSDALRTGAVGTSPSGPTPVVAAQDLLAELAVITRERPSDGRHMLLTVPRDWRPDPAVAAAQLAALDTAPWVRTEPVSTLVGTSVPPVARGTLPSRTVDPAEVTRSTLTQMRTALDARTALASMVPEPERLVGDVEAELLALTSVAWRSDPDGRSALPAGAQERTASLASAVTVDPGSTVNLISTSGDLRMRVLSTLDQPATVEVRLDPDDWRLRVDDSVVVTVPPGGEEVVQLPVHAIQSADVPVNVELRTVGGELLDVTPFTVRVRAEWEGIGTAVFGSLLALVMVLGVVRTIRRGRTGARAEPVVAGPDALSPEATEAAEAAGAADAAGDELPEDRP